MLVCLDYGRRRIGIATAKSKIIASPYKILEIKSNPFKEVLEELKVMGDIKKIYIGLPRHMDGNHSEISLEVLSLKKFLEENSSWKIELVDERLSSQMALKINKKNKRRIDDIVATEILNSILVTKSS